MRTDQIGRDTSSEDGARAVQPHRLRDPVSWLALGLGVSLALVFATRVVTFDRPSPRPISTERGVPARASAIAARDATSKPHENVEAKASVESTDRTDAASHPRRRLSRLASDSSLAVAPVSDLGSKRQPAQGARYPLTSRFEGTLSFPSDVSISYDVPTALGAFVLTGSWPTSTVLDVGLSCAGTHLVRRASSGVELHLRSSAGSCIVSISLPSGGASSSRYELLARYSASKLIDTP